MISLKFLKYGFFHAGVYCGTITITIPIRIAIVIAIASKITDSSGI